MHNITLDFSNPGLPQVIDVMQSDAQSRFIGITLYDGGVPYSAPSGAVYTVEYHGQGANNTGWYDTIQFSSGTRKAVVVSSSSPNVVTLELAEQALRVNGKVEVSLCVVNNTGYKLNTFPIVCRVTGAPYVDPVAVRSYFYVTGLTSEQWLAYVTACQDAQKRAEDAAAKLVIDTTLTQAGQAADAKATGDVAGEIKENLAFYMNQKLTSTYDCKKDTTSIVLGNVPIIEGHFYIIHMYSNDADLSGATIGLKEDNGGKFHPWASKQDIHIGIIADKTDYESFIWINLNTDATVCTEIWDSSIDKNSIKWIYGAIDYNSGTYIMPSDHRYNYRIAYNGFISQAVKQIEASDGYQISLWKYDKNENFIGLDSPNSYWKKICILDHSKFKYKIVFRKADDSETLRLADSENILFLENIRKMPSTIIVAASDSSDKDKIIADYVCDGLNDEVEIQKAISDLNTAGTCGTVLLCDGTYFIDSLYYSGNDILGYFALYMDNPSVVHSLIIKGMGHPTVTGKTEVGGSAKIYLTKKSIENIDRDRPVTIIGALPSDINNLKKTYPNLYMSIEHVAINYPSNEYAITGISGEYLSGMSVNDILISVSNAGVLSTTPNKKSIGIRGLPGWNFGVNYRIDNVFVFGFGVAYDIGGEHLIMTSCGCRQCDITYRFNAYEKPDKMSHPQTLINCCEEGCKRSMYFCRSNTKQSINIVDFNIEYRPLEFSGTWDRTTKAVEERPGDYRGRITYSANHEDYVNSDDIEFWKEGSGLNIKTENLNHKLCGTKDERPSKPNSNQQFYDTTLNKMLYFINGNWVDAMGAQIE